MKKAILSVIAALFCLAAAAQPVIGISSSHKSNGSISVGDSYINAVVKAGGIPVVLPLATSEEMAKQLIGAVDGIVLVGGEDFNPKWYGEEVLNETVEINAVRDTSDIRIVRAAAAAGKPILGICRGHQAVAVALGGSLIQDIPTQVPGCLAHRQKEPSSVTTMTMGITPGSKLSAIFGGATAIPINSHHHQAVRTPGRGTKIVGVAIDGVTEACESTGDNFILTIQSHPEKLIEAGNDFYMPVFKALIEACRKN